MFILIITGCFLLGGGESMACESVTIRPRPISASQTLIRMQCEKAGRSEAMRRQRKYNRIAPSFFSFKCVKEDRA